MVESKWETSAQLISDPYELVKSLASELDAFFVDEDPSKRNVEAFWRIRQGITDFGSFYLRFVAAFPELGRDSISGAEYKRAFERAIRPGLLAKLQTHYVIEGLPTVPDMAKVATKLDHICPDLDCVSGYCPADSNEFTCPVGKGSACTCDPSKSPSAPSPAAKSQSKGTCPKCHLQNAGHSFKCERFNQGSVMSINGTTPLHLARSAPQHGQHPRITDNVVFGRIIKHLKSMQAIDPDSTTCAEWCRKKGICPDCIQILDQAVFNRYLSE